MRLGKTLTICILAMELTFALPIWAQEKPFTQDQISNMVHAGLGDDSGAKLIEQRGIDFAPADDFLQRLKTAGASEAFIKSLRASNRPAAASAKPHLTQVQILALLAGGVPTHRVAMLVGQRGIDFEVKDDFLQEIRKGGGDDEIIAALNNAKPVLNAAAAVDPGVQARQDEVRQHMVRGLDFATKGQNAQAEHEYRAALQLDPQSAEVNMSLAFVLIRQQKWDDAEAAEREALRLDPDNDLAHNNLGVALGTKGDVDGAIPQFREALRLNPNSADAHANLGAALGIKGDVDGAIVEYRAALRLSPNYGTAHYNLAVALERKGEYQEALDEYHAAYTLNPNDADSKRNYERLSKKLNR